MVTMVNAWLVVMVTIVVATSGTHGDVSITLPASGSMEAQVGEFVNFHCVDSDGGEVEWVVDSPFGELVIEDKPPFILTSAQDSSGYKLFLTIEGVEEEDASDYTCRSKANPGDNQVVSLTVFAEGAAPPAGWTPPKIELREGQDTVEVEVNKELRLRCQGGDKNSKLEFRHNGDVIMEDTHSFMTEATGVALTQATVLLTRAPAITEYSGEYTCRDVAFSSPEDSVHVDVIEHPSARVEIIEPSGMQSKVMIGDNFNLKCQSSMKTMIKWYHGDDQLENEQGGFIIGVSEDMETRMRTSVLTKEGAELADAGKYRCVNADEPQEEASIEVDVKTEGGDDDASFMDGLFGGAPGMTASVLIVFLATFCALL